MAEPFCTLRTRCASGPWEIWCWWRACWPSFQAWSRPGPWTSCSSFWNPWDSCPRLRSSSFGGWRLGYPRISIPGPDWCSDFYHYEHCRLSWCFLMNNPSRSVQHHIILWCNVAYILTPLTSSLEFIGTNPNPCSSSIELFLWIHLKNFDYFQPSKLNSPAPSPSGPSFYWRSSPSKVARLGWLIYLPPLFLEAKVEHPMDDNDQMGSTNRELPSQNCQGLFQYWWSSWFNKLEIASSEKWGVCMKLVFGKWNNFIECHLWSDSVDIKIMKGWQPKFMEGLAKHCQLSKSALLCF